MTRTAKNWSREALPIGTVRIRQRGKGPRVRMIKVRDDGPSGSRWMQYARWWWLQNRGPVPAGKRVCHLDGDTLNDDPSNYRLLTAGDVVFMAHDRDPEMSRKNYAACRAATSEHNRLRARLRRMREWLPTRWYPVDLRAGVIVNQPRRQEWQAYQLAGVDVSRDNWRHCHSIALGWPEIPRLHACIVRVLADRDELATADLFDAVRRLQAKFAWPRVETKHVASWTRQRAPIDSKSARPGPELADGDRSAWRPLER
jgi:hypothetical protein